MISWPGKSCRGASGYFGYLASSASARLTRQRHRLVDLAAKPAGGRPGPQLINQIFLPHSLDLKTADDPSFAALHVDQRNWLGIEVRKVKTGRRRGSKHLSMTEKTRFFLGKRQARHVA